MVLMALLENGIDFLRGHLRPCLVCGVRDNLRLHVALEGFWGLCFLSSSLGEDFPYEWDVSNNYQV